MRTSELPVAPWPALALVWCITVPLGASPAITSPYGCGGRVEGDVYGCSAAGQRRGRGPGYYLSDAAADLHTAGSTRRAPGGRLRAGAQSATTLMRRAVALEDLAKLPAINTASRWGEVSAAFIQVARLLPLSDSWGIEAWRRAGRARLTQGATHYLASAVQTQYLAGAARRARGKCKSADRIRLLRALMCGWCVCSEAPAWMPGGEAHAAQRNEQEVGRCPGRIMHDARILAQAGRFREAHAAFERMIALRPAAVTHEGWTNQAWRSGRDLNQGYEGDCAVQHAPGAAMPRKRVAHVMMSPARAVVGFLRQALALFELGRFGESLDCSQRALQHLRSLGPLPDDL